MNISIGTICLDNSYHALRFAGTCGRNESQAGWLPSTVVL